MAAGMECGYKELWAGPEDKKGKYIWLETRPDDLGNPAENSETAKYALVVRHSRVHNDPRRVLKIHSIVVQSPLLKTLLGAVLKDYPGVTTSLKRLVFGGRFEPFIHRWNELLAAVAAADAETRRHGDLLVSLLKEELAETIDEYLDLKQNGVVTFKLLWTIFLPDMLVYARVEGQERAMQVLETQYGQDTHGNAIFWLTSEYVGWDGSKHGTAKLNIPIHVFTGTMEIIKMRAVPLDLHPDKTLRQRLIERGQKAEALAGIHYKQYDGVGWIRKQMGNELINCRERIVIDAAAFNKNNPNSALRVSAFRNRQHAMDDEDEEDFEFEEDSEGMPRDGHFPDETDTRVPLTETQLLITTPEIRGYALSSKLWLNLFVNCVKEIEFNEDAFSSLVLPEEQKELILGFTETQKDDTFDDVIQGKGRGIILLLMGPPGVGKTLTAESVAEQMRRPLYAISASDLGSESRHVERNLTSTLEMCANWKSILLIDEADVVLEQRSLHELERNKLVTVFLRLLEYYKGIMFLTTNRVQTFDAAFQSRIHISLNYPELSAESRLTVWSQFLSRNAHVMSEADQKKLAQVELNGRQIKNTVKTGQLLAKRRKEPLSYNHIQTVLNVTQHWHNTTRETDRARSAIYY